MEKKTISAHELSKFVYCPYQWYYERLYGRKELRRLYQERNERLSLEDSLASHFQEGEAYHQHNYIRLRWRHTLMKVGVLLFVIAGIFAYIMVRYGVNF